MTTFITIGYGDADGYARTAETVRAQAHRHDAELVGAGARVGVAGPPVQVRNADGAGVQRMAGAYLRSDLPVAGFGILEADNLDAAVAMAAGTPCAVAHGVVEVWPLGD